MKQLAQFIYIIALGPIYNKNTDLNHNLLHNMEFNMALDFWPLWAWSEIQNFHYTFPDQMHITIYAYLEVSLLEYIVSRRR